MPQWQYGNPPIRPVRTPSTEPAVPAPRSTRATYSIVYFTESEDSPLPVLRIVNATGRLALAHEALTITDLDGTITLVVPIYRLVKAEIIRRIGGK